MFQHAFRTGGYGAFLRWTELEYVAVVAVTVVDEVVERLSRVFFILFFEVIVIIIETVIVFAVI